MCFSATANFVDSGALGAVGIATLTKVKHRRELLFASLPTLFAVHQLIEGFVWLGLDGVLSAKVAHNFGAAFVLCAQGLLPFLMPLSVMLFEQTRARRRAMMPFVILGGLLALYMLWGLTVYPLRVSVDRNGIVYVNDATNKTWVAALYIIATCGSLFFSEIFMMVAFGLENLVILLVFIDVKRYAGTSVWCAYAALASVTVLVYFLESAENRPFRYIEAL
ncbi:DUF6629 family protein [Granulicella sibirica]|uniref:Arginine/ornithine antiporter ArcD n=1 Tax=Granulicella sibirica TaxID=2479048 RepID=A0A4Q0SZP3_9BACT|nr:DUF6629 family protein [Granulicella sibirica]RXH55892.1 Arginine/ornithine antiporter ArcD [Granulicella sibirica]